MIAGYLLENCWFFNAKNCWFYYTAYKNEALIRKQREILSFRDLADGTVSSYISYLSQFIDWVESDLNKPVQDVSWAELRSYVDHLRQNRKIGNRTINVHIAQLHHFWHYVLKRDWDKYEVPFLKYDTTLPAVLSVQEIHAIIDSPANIKHRAELEHVPYIANILPRFLINDKQQLRRFTFLRLSPSFAAAFLRAEIFRSFPGMNNTAPPGQE